MAMAATDLPGVFATFDQAYGLALADVPQPGPWARTARCRTAPVEIFFPTRGDNVDPARRICNRCPVIDQCRQYALQYPNLRGIWAGLTELEREQLQAALDNQPPPPPEPQPDRPANSPAGALTAALEQLAQHPGRWARVAHYHAKHSAPSVASMLRTGRRTPPPGQWQFQARLNPAGGSDLYAIFEGDPDADIR